MMKSVLEGIKGFIVGDYKQLERKHYKGGAFIAFPTDMRLLNGG